MKTSDEKWPPPPLNPDALGEIYNLTYAQAVRDFGAPVEDAHQYACRAVFRAGFYQATGGRSEHPAVTELKSAAEGALLEGQHEGECDTEDGACDKHWEASATRKARLAKALEDFTRVRGYLKQVGP